uniref:gibberellin 2beta-dioxygenase n=1 Tax=Liriodendron chinense TaxID=3414 RepID=A0A977LLL3_LIRCH|nr:GA2ox3 [Liriodendron chinense]
MVVLSKPAIEQISLIQNHKPTFFSGLPTIDLSKPDSKTHLVKASEEVGFFKVTNHGVPMDFMERLEAEAVKFFSLAQPEKEQAGPANPFGFGNKIIGPNGDLGWVEYLLLQTNAKSISQISLAISRENREIFCSAVNDYISAVKKLACEVLELLAEGLKIQTTNVFSKLLMDEESDSVFRINHYPPCPEIQALDCNLTGFGEHTDPQIISVLRSNKTSGLQISLPDGSWVSVPPDHTSFFFIIGDSLQVMTNGRFRSVKHRVLANSQKSRVSMIYFGAPALRERIRPMPVLMNDGDESLYRDFTWSEYKKSAYKSRLADYRLGLFEKREGLL